MKAVGDHLSRNHCNWTITKIFHTVLCAFIRPWRRAEILRQRHFLPFCAQLGHSRVLLFKQNESWMQWNSQGSSIYFKLRHLLMNATLNSPTFSIHCNAIRLSKSTLHFNCVSKAFGLDGLTNSFCWWLCETCILHSFTFNASFQWQALHTWLWKRTIFLYAITEFKWLMLTNKNDNRTLMEVMWVTAACWDL